MAVSDAQTGQTILLVAGPGNAVAERVALALRQRGESVVVASEPQVVRDEAARARACIIVLAGGGTDDLATSAALRQQFTALIPIVDAGQPLPPGNWTSTPITYGGFIGPVVAQVLAVVSDPHARQAEIAGRMAAIFVPPVSLPPAKTEKEIKQERRLASTKKWRWAILIIRLALLLIYLPLAFFGIINRHSYPNYAATDAKFAQQQHALALQTYDAMVPGNGCDKGGALWEGFDPNINTCTNNGLLMAQTDHRYLDEMRFGYYYYDEQRASFFPKTYQVGVRVSIADANGSTCVGLSVHQLYNGLGGQVYLVCPDGYWELYQLGQDGAYATTLRQGYVAHAKLPLTAFTLRIDVAGATMRLYLDDALLETVLDPTYLATSQVSLVLDGSSKGPETPTAFFSQFHYAPQWDGDSALDATYAAAQSAQKRLLAQPYSAANPGPCATRDKAWWEPTTNDVGTNSTLHCRAAGLAMTRLDAAPLLTEETFFYHNGLYSQDYRLSVTLDLSASHGGCAGFLTRSQGHRSYGYFVCADGRWSIEWYAGDGGRSIDLLTGYGTPCGTCTLSSTDVGSQHTIFIDGRSVGTTTDSDYLSTGSVSLSIANSVSFPTTVVFSDFTVTPL